MILVTLFATTNSTSYIHWLQHTRGRCTYLSCEFVANEETVLDFDGSNHVFGEHHHLLLLLLKLELLGLKHGHLVLLLLSYLLLAVGRLLLRLLQKHNLL